MLTKKQLYMKKWRLENKDSITRWRRKRYLKHKVEEAKTHALWIARNPEYTTWLDMKSRCYDSKSVSYMYYGAKGVTVCTSWLKSYRQFIQDLGKRPEGKTLDRIDPYGNYEPSNCRWATAMEQRHNRRAACH